MDTAWRYDTFSCDILDLNAIHMLKYRTRKKIDWAGQLGEERLFDSQVQKIPNFAYQIYQTLQI